MSEGTRTPFGSADDASEDLELVEREPVTIHVELPPTVHEAPEHEIAVALSEVAVTPDTGPTAAAAGLITSIEIDVEEHAALPAVDPADEPVVPPLPAHDDPAPTSRRRRRALASAPPPVPLPQRRLGRAARRADAPEGRLQKLVWDASLHLVHLDDAFAVRERKSLDSRIGAELDGGTRFVAVVGRKGGVGQTTVAALLALATARVRQDLVVALDANADRGTLGDRFGSAEDATVTDLVERSRELRDPAAFRELVGAEPGRLVVLGSDRDPLRTEVFGVGDFALSAEVVEQSAGVVVTDTGTALMQDVTRAALRRADAVVVVSGAALDEAQLASETLDWLEAHGGEELAAGAVVVLNTATATVPPARLDEIEAHFAARARAVIRMPYDPALAGGAPVREDQLSPLTRDMVRELAALVVDGLAAPELEDEAPAGASDAEVPAS